MVDCNSLDRCYHIRSYLSHKADEAKETCCITSVLLGRSSEPISHWAPRYLWCYFHTVSTYSFLSTLGLWQILFAGKRNVSIHWHFRQLFSSTFVTAVSAVSAQPCVKNSSLTAMLEQRGWSTHSRDHDLIQQLQGELKCPLSISLGSTDVLITDHQCSCLDKVGDKLTYERAVRSIDYISWTIWKMCIFGESRHRNSQIPQKQRKTIALVVEMHLNVYVKTAVSCASVSTIYSRLPWYFNCLSSCLYRLQLWGKKGAQLGSAGLI